MELAPDPEDEDAVAAAVAQLVGLFERSQDGRDLGWVVEQLLQFKHGYLDGDLGRWTAADLSEILFELYPRKVVLEPGDEAQVLVGTAAFLRFLDAQGLLRGEDGQELAGLVEQAGDKFLRAMRDERKWGPGKRLFGGASAAGVDLSDRRQLDAYIHTVNSLPDAAREALLGPGLGSGAPLAPRALPPVVLAPPQELLRAARSSVLLGWVRGLVEHVGAGLALTDKGNLKLADAQHLADALGTDDRIQEVVGGQRPAARSSTELADVDLTFRLAVAAGLLTVSGRRLIPTDAAAMPADDPLEAVVELWLALIEDVGPVQHRWGEDAYGFGWYADEVDGQLLAWHLDMYGAPGGLDVTDAAGALWEQLREDLDLEDPEPATLELHQELFDRAVADAFARLAQLGVVQFDGPPSVQPDLVDAADSPAHPTLGQNLDPAARQQDESKAALKEVSTTARLSPLGTWVVQRTAAQSMTAPVAGALADLDASELLCRAVDLAEDLARLEVRNWVQQRPGDEGLNALVSALPSASEAARSLVFAVLVEVGDAAVQAVEPLKHHPQLAAFRTVLRVDALCASEAEMVAENPEQWVRLLGAVLELRGAQALTAWAGPSAGPTGLPAVLEVAWRVRLPQTGPVLEALASTTTDKAVAKAARKAAYKFRSSR